MRQHLILATFLSALLAAPALHAQPAKEGGKPPAQRMRDCSKAEDKKACEDRQSKVREAITKANEACKGKTGPEHHACMRDSVCSEAKDPARCKERADKVGQLRKACEGKKDDELRKCMRDERAKTKAEKKPETK